MGEHDDRHPFQPHAPHRDIPGRAHAVEKVLVAHHGLKSQLKPPHPPFDAGLRDGLEHYGPGVLFDLWQECRAVEALRLANVPLDRRDFAYHSGILENGTRMARPKGVRETKPRNTPTRKMMAVALATGLSPLEIMLATAQKAWQMASDLSKQGGADADVLALMQVASKEASSAAPYLHPKLANEVHRVINDDSKFSDAEIERELAELERRRAAASVATRTVEAPVPPVVPGILH